ncbi:MAG: DUF1080 domain-containing protein [Planctomycetia bacterium]|nr:DUF1080 domain-containing protein [Planctomycetia bacterium]
MRFPSPMPAFFLAGYLVLCALLHTAGLQAGEPTEPAFVPLFNGHDIAGWHTLPGGTWEVRDGAIVGTSPASEPKHGLLVTDRKYKNFILRAEFKVVRGNSGLYFRCEERGSTAGVGGLQAEVDNSPDVGGLYETGGRGWVQRPDHAKTEAIAKRGDWNSMVIRAIGPDVTVLLNGSQTVELVNDGGRREGPIALQLHGGQDMEVHFRNLEILEIPGDEGFVPLLNGKDLTGWQTTGNWIPEGPSGVTLKPRPGESGWRRYGDYLTTTKPYKNFILDLEFQYTRGGNSGVFLRVGNPNNHVDSGFEVQILDTFGKKSVGHHDCGGIVNTAAPSKNMVKPAGEWNRYVITCVGPHLEVELNGEAIIDLDLATSAVKNRPPEGLIGFQDEGRPVSYRTMRIRELP